MPRQLIYTSAPRGLTPGQSGYCTVARSRDLREALIPRIEKLSYYTPEPHHNPTICAHRILDMRGTKFHVLSRIVDAGLDFTRRRGFLAHHLIFEPDELESAATPAEIFLKWNGWLGHWRGDPQWLEDNRPLPPRTERECSIAKTDIWITGAETDRNNFLPTLVDRGANWEITLTNCFQPGDDPADFHIKAAWPNTPGCDAAQRFDPNFICLQELPAATKRSTTPGSELAPQTPSRVALPSATPHPANPLGRHWPFLAGALTLIAFLLALLLRPPPPRNLLTPPPPPSVRPPEITSELNIFLPDRPTWLAPNNHSASIPPVEELMRQLRANEIFTKDLSCTIQTNLHSPPFAASLFAQPELNLIRFAATNCPPVEMFISNGASIKTELPNSFAVEIPGRFRILTVKTPVELSRHFLVLSPNIELHPVFRERIHRVELPTGAQLALRPLVFSKGAWIDPLASLERDFALIPSTILDLPAVEAHARQIISDKETKLRAYEHEQAALADAQKKLLTAPQTAAEFKAKDRLNALQLAIPKATHELESLRAKAAAIPKGSDRIERFALFHCLSNVNTEIIRFIDKP